MQKFMTISQGVWPHIQIDGRNAESLTSLRSNENAFISVFRFLYLLEQLSPIHKSE